MKSESRFIQELESRTVEQQKLVQTELIPDWAKGLGDWLAVNPWRVLVPIAGIWYLVARSWFGVNFRELTLGLFGGFAR